MALDRAPLLDRRFLDAVDALRALRALDALRSPARAAPPPQGDAGLDAPIRPGGAVAQVLIARRWRGLRDRSDFLAMQSGDRPVVLAMQRPEQRAHVV